MIAIYGANGFIGQHIVEHFLAQGHNVRAVARKFDPHIAEAWRGRVDMIEGNFNNAMQMLSSLNNVETVIQLISSSSPGLGNKLLVEDIEENVIPHVSFMRNAILSGVKKYIFVSSGGTVYGPGAPVPTPETAHTNPINSHGMTKLMIEKYLQMFGRVDGLNYIILRVSNPFGPGQIFKKGQGLIPAILQRHREGKPIQIFGDGSNERDYIYVSDLVEAIEKSAISDAVTREVLNIGKGEGRSILDVVSAIESALGVTLDREFHLGRNTDVDRSILDNSKAKELLSWSPDVTFDSGIRMMCNALA